MMSAFLFYYLRVNLSDVSIINDTEGIKAISKGVIKFPLHGLTDSAEGAPANMDAVLFR